MYVYVCFGCVCVCVLFGFCQTTVVGGFQILAVPQTVAIALRLFGMIFACFCFFLLPL